MAIKSTEIQREVQRLGLHIEEQSQYYKVTSGSFVLHFARTKMVTRIHLKGFDDLVHPAIRRLSRKEAEESHLGKVTRVLDFEQPHDVVWSALSLCLSRMAQLGGTIQSPSDATDRGEAISLRVPRDLLEALEKVRELIPVGKGIEVSREDTIRFLLYRAVEAEVWLRE